MLILTSDKAHEVLHLANCDRLSQNGVEQIVNEACTRSGTVVVKKLAEKFFWKGK